MALSALRVTTSFARPQVKLRTLDHLCKLRAQSFDIGRVLRELDHRGAAILEERPNM